MRRISHLLLAACLGLVPGLIESGWAAPARQLSVEPPVLNIGTFYSGGEVTISGEVPHWEDVVIEIAGPRTDEAFDIKGRVGPFWMTRGRAQVDGAPSMYVLLLPEGQQWHQQASAFGLGLTMLHNKVAVQSSSAGTDDLFDMFLKLKQSEGLYLEKENAVTYTAAANGRRQFKAVYRFPRATSAGEYTIKATLVSRGIKDAEESIAFPVAEVGFTRLVDELATHRRLIYGILAVLIALGAGAIMGFLFKGGGSH